jgi:hypothetical protein
MGKRLAELSRTLQALLAIGLLNCGLFCQQTHAALAEGIIDFGGSVKFDTKSLATATKVKVWNNPLVLDELGDFATFVAPGDSATMAMPWFFQRSTPTPAPWSVGGFKFDLTSSFVVSQSAKFLSITGSGTISGNDFDLTPGSWSFTSSKVRGSTSTDFAFQTATSPVPEPSALVMLLGGFASLVGAQRLFRRRS